MAGPTRPRSSAPRGTRGAPDDTESPPPAVPRVASRLGLLAPLGAAALAHIVYLHVMYDDAFITYRYAENLARGLGLVYNAGERVEGYSNFLWTLMMAVVVKLGGRPEDFGPAISAAIALATLALVVWAQQRRGGNGVLAGALLAVSACWATWATGGLETALFGGLVTLGAIALMIAIETPGRTNGRMLLVSALACGLACLTRPDGPLVAACLGLVVAGLAMTKRLSWRAAFAWLALAALIVVPHIVWRWSYYGRLVPNTYAVKPPGMTRFVFGWAYLRDAARDLHLYWLAIPLALAAVLRAPARGLRGIDFTIVAAVVVPFTLYLASTGGDFMPVFRFVAPLLPLLTLAAAAALEGVAARLTARGMATAGVAFIAIVGLAYGALNLRESWRQQRIWNEGELVSVAWARREVDDWLRIGDLLHKVALPTDTLATTAAGAAPYRSRLYTIDMLGLNAADLSHYRRLPSNRPGHMILLEERELAEHPPQILLAHPLVHDNPSHLGLSLDLRPGWHDPVYSHYEVVGLTLLGKPLRYVACALRLDASQRIVEAGKRAQAELGSPQGVAVPAAR